MKKYKLVEGGLAWRVVKVVKPLGFLVVAGAFLAVYSLASADDLEMHKRMEEVSRPVAVAEAEEINQSVNFQKTESKEEPRTDEWESLGTYTITAYCPCETCCGQWADGITASGEAATEGVTIAASSELEFGTVVRIDGHEYTVQDRGGAIAGNRLDIFMSDHQSALNFGIQTKKVEVKK